MREFVEIFKDDLRGLDKVWSATYRNGEPFEPRGEFDEHFHFALVEDGQAIAGCGIVKMTATRGKALLKSGGVLGVAVLPEHRRGGVGSQLMKGVNRELRERGFEIAALHAFREPFYRKFGYELCGVRYCLSVDTAYLPTVTSDTPVYVVPTDQWGAIHECNKTFSHLRSGLNVRSESNWRAHLPADSHLRIYAVGTPVEAYCIVKHKVDFWVPQNIEEFVWTTKRGYEAMIGFFKQLGINKTKITWVEPSDSPYHSRFWDFSAEVTSIKVPIMYRVLDVPAALKLLQTTESGSFTIKVNDPDIPENNGPWLVSFSPEQVSVETSDTAELEMDIQQFTQGFLGDPSFAQLAMNQLITVHDERALKAACALMPHSPTMCLEFF